MPTDDAVRAVAFLAALSTVSGCAGSLPAVPGEPTDTFFRESASDHRVGRSMEDSAQRCRERLIDLRTSASGYRLTATVLSLLSGSIGVMAGTASASLLTNRPGDAKALGVTAAVAAGLTAVITPVLRPDAREQAYLAGYFRWQMANVRLRSLYTSEPLPSTTGETTEAPATSQVPWARAERFQQAWSAMADDLDVCAGTSYR
jgi:hypothetical protein